MVTYAKILFARIRLNHIHTHMRLNCCQPYIIARFNILASQLLSVFSLPFLLLIEAKYSLSCCWCVSVHMPIIWKMHPKSMVTYLTAVSFFFFFVVCIYIIHTSLYYSYTFQRHIQACAIENCHRLPVTYTRTFRSSK